VELPLNSAWTLTTIALVRFSLRPERRAPEDPHAPLASLIISAAILFPVISISDGLRLKQDSADTSSYQRCDHQASCPYFVTPVIATLPETSAAGQSFCFQRLAMQLYSPSSPIVKLTFESIQNRPPPLPDHPPPLPPPQSERSARA